MDATDGMEPDEEATDGLSVESDSDFDPAEQVIRDHEYASAYFSRWHELIAEEVEFVLDQEQHEVDLGHSKDDDEVQAKDLSLLSMSRRKWSQIAAAPIYVNCYGQNQSDADPLAAERTKWAIEHEVYDSRRMFRRKRRRAIIGCVVGRIWYMGADWDADLKDLVYSTLMPTQVFKCPGFHDLHDPLNPWCIVEYELTVDEARRLARVRAESQGMPEAEIRELVNGIVADADSAEGQGTTSRPNAGLAPGMVKLDQSNPEGGPGTGLQGRVKFLRAMYRKDPERAEIEEQLGPPEDLPAEDHFMRCWTCGNETQDHPFDPETGAFPDSGEPCPECAQHLGESAPAMEAVRQVESVDQYEKYPQGRWIEVLKESRTTVYDGEWPYRKPNGETLRSFPLGEYTIYDDPRHEIPHSDASWQWNQQCLATFMLQWAVEQMRTSGRIIIMPQNALVDSRGRQIKYTNRLDQIAWIRDPMLAKAIQEFQPRGLPDGWGELYATLQGSFRSNLGTGELNLGAEQSKNLPVGTVHAIIESGDIPTDDAIAMVREGGDAPFLGVISDMIQCCWDEARWVRYLGKDGQLAFEYISGADLTGVDVEIQADPGFDVLQSAKLDRMKVWFDMTPPQQRLSAQLLNLEPSRVAQFQQDNLAWAQSMQQLQAPGGGGAPPVGGGQGGPTPSARSPRPVRPDVSTAGVGNLSPDLQQGLASMALA